MNKAIVKVTLNSGEVLEIPFLEISSQALADKDSALITALVEDGSIKRGSVTFTLEV